MDKSNRNKRSVQNVLINRPLQREFTLVMLAIMMAAGLGAGAIIHLRLKKLMSDLPSTISRVTLESMVLDVHAELLVGIILVLFLAVIATGFFGAFFLHRVAGPIHRFQSIPKRIGKGELIDEVRTRRRDFFPELATAINAVIGILKRYHSSFEVLRDGLKDLDRGQLSSGEKAKVAQMKDAIKQVPKVKR